MHVARCGFGVDFSWACRVIWESSDAISTWQAYLETLKYGGVESPPLVKGGETCNRISKPAFVTNGSRAAFRKPSKETISRHPSYCRHRWNFPKILTGV